MTNILLVQSFEEGTNGTTISTGNSGSPSNAFDAVNIGTGATVAFDNTHAAHGTLAGKIATTATAASANMQWAASMGTLSQVWFRVYVYMTANPAANTRLFAAFNSGTMCGALRINTNGKVAMQNAAGSQVFATTNSIALNQWVRIEGFITGSATVGQLSVSLYNSDDSTTATETQTSAATINTSGSMNQYNFGVGSVSNAGPYWLDDLGLSNFGAIGPATSGPGSSPTYLVGKNSAVSGGATTLNLPVTGTVGAGDTILVGALATAGSVTGVSDVAGNTYSLIQSETVNTGCQLYTFAAYNADALAPGTHTGTAGRVGSTVSVGNYPGAGTSRQTGANDFDAITGQSWANSTQKIYTPTIPSALQDASGHDLTSLVNGGCQFWICCQPALDGSSLSQMQTALQFWLSHGAKIKVVMYQEPQGNNFGITAAQFIQVYKTYYPMINALGIPVVYDALGYKPSLWVSWYPGDNFVDEVAVDFYSDTYNQQTKNGTTNLDPLLPLRQVADKGGKPFGVGEIGYTNNIKSLPSQARFNAYINYLKNVFTTRLNQGLVNSDIMWYNGDPNANGPNTLQTNGNVNAQPGALGSPIQAVAQLKSLYSAITNVATGITVTYSTNTSAQAAIAIGDHGVQAASDKVVGNTATSGTTASVATGTLAQAQEHITAFEANLSAGGSPVLGDSLATLATVQVTSGPYLTAGSKAVSVTTSDTPSATIASTTWSISAVTNAQAVPVITGAPSQGFTGLAYSFTFQQTGGVTPVTWSSTGTLPPGLALSSSGVLSGTPTTPGSYSATISVTDSLGLVGTLAVTVVIVASTSLSNAPPQPLQGNILSLGDSDAETSTGWTWAPFQNANTPVRSNLFSVAGGNCTQWSAATAGDTSASTGLYPVSGNLPYICSGFIYPSDSLNCYLSIVWYDITQTRIALDSAVGVPSTQGAWQPLSFNTVSPANAAYASLVVTASAANAGDLFNFDLGYLTQSSVQVLVDWVNPVFSSASAGGQAFMDVTPWYRHDIGLYYTRGRQDAVSQVQAGSGSLSLQNDIGTFTRFSTASIPENIGGSVSLQRRCQVNLADQNGLFYTRFDGSVAEISYGFDSTGNTSLANITLTDALSGLSRQDPLFCWTKEQVLANSPLYHWSLSDPGDVGGLGVGGSGAFGVGAETGGSNGPPLRLFSSDKHGTATITWQDTGGGVETLANAAAAGSFDGSEYWTPGLNQPSQPNRGLDSGTVGPFTTPLPSVRLVPDFDNTQTSQNNFIANTGYSLTAELPTTFTCLNDAQSFSVECWATFDPGVASKLGGNYGPFVAVSLGSSRNYSNLSAGLWLTSGTGKWFAGTWSQPPAFRGLNYPGTAVPTATGFVSGTAFTGDTNKLPHHIVLSVTYNDVTPGPQVTLYVDNLLIGTFALPAGQSYDTITVGGAFGGAGSWYGNVSLVSIYSSALKPSQIALDCQLGQYGMWETPSDDALAQVASYANIPSFWSNVAAQHNGLTMMEYSDITGSNALTAMQLIAQAENGLLYVDATGALNYHTRDWRMGYGAPDLLLPPESFQPAMNYQLVDQFMCNEMAVAGATTSGANTPVGSSVSTTTGFIQQSPNAVASANTQAGYINAASQAQYGTYSANPVGSPISLPLITWSRAYAQLGIPGLTYWGDPNLIGVAAWNANSRADPWMFPASLTVDLLTLDSNDTVTTLNTGGQAVMVPLGINVFYQLEIDNMVAPSGTLPGSFPNEAGALEWFIEGVSETFSVSARSIQLVLSPAKTQRAWIPGDATYGVLGSTTRIGVASMDLSVPQADGKDVSHDAGPPYWPTTFSGAMNNPSGSGNAFVGDLDIRGIAGNLQDLLTPAMLVVSADQDAQSITNGALTDPTIMWDAIYVDTEGGMGALPGFPQWYVVTKPGWYEIDAKVALGNTPAQAGYTAQAWIVVSENAAQVVTQTGGATTPITNAKFVCPVGEAVGMNSASMNPICCMSTRMYLGLGDMVAIAVEQNYTAARSLSSSVGGSTMSLRRVGIGTVDDRTEINSSAASGGTVTIPAKGTLQQVSFDNLHTYTYQGKSGFSPYALRSTDKDAIQGLNGKGSTWGSQTAQIQFSRAAMSAILSGHQIQSATLTGTNLTSYFSTGTVLILGTTTDNLGAAHFNAQDNQTNGHMFTQAFQTGQTLTFVIPNSMVKPFITGSQTAFVLGNSLTTDLSRFGGFSGGPGAWTLTINYI